MQKQKICLVIDDDPNIRLLLEAKLRKDDQYDVYLAADGDEGVKLARQVSPDVILLDWVMPGKTGINVLKEIRAHWALNHIPIFMLTGRNHVSDMERAIDVGATGYFTKPIKLSVLCKRLRFAMSA